MSSWWRRLTGALTIAALGLGAAACGSSSAGGSTAGSTMSSGAAQAGTTGGGNDLLHQVQSSGQLTVAMAPFAPLEFQDSHTKAWKGFDVDMLTAFAKSLNAKLVVDAMPFAATIQAVHSKRADITANIFKTPQREQAIAFSEPVLNYVDGVIVNSQTPQVSTDSAQALQGKTIGTCRGCAEEGFFSKLPQAKDQSFDSADDSFLAVSTGRVAAAFQPVMYAEYAVHTNPSLHIKELGPIPKAIAGDQQDPQGFYGVAQGSYSQSFLDKLNAFLTQQCQNGATAGILKNYGLTDPSYLKGLC